MPPKFSTSSCWKGGYTFTAKDAEANCKVMGFRTLLIYGSTGVCDRVCSFALTDRASTTPSNIRGCQSSTWSQRGTTFNGSHHGDSRYSDQQGSESRQNPCQVQPPNNIGNLSASRRCLWVRRVTQKVVLAIGGLHEDNLYDTL